MRQRYEWKPGAAGARWPDGVSGVNLPPFNWIKIENRGGNPVRVGLNAGIIDDDQDYLFSVPNGHVRVMNIAGPKNDPEHGDPWAQELHLISVTGGTTVHIEVADHPIVDFDQAI